MSFNVGQAMVVIRGKTDELKGDLDDAKRDTNSWASGLGKAASGLVAGAVVGGALAAGTAIIGIGAAAFEVGQDLDTAQRNLQAQLGITKLEAIGLGEVAKNVWGNNFAGSITEAADAVGKINQVMSLSGEEAGKAAENAFRLSDAYGIDVAEGISAAQTLVENFGMSADEAFDLIAAGNQKGLNRSGDFIDSIEEYSTQFASGGASAEQFFNLMESGLAGGMLGTDKAADLFKEFRVRLTDGSAATATALDGIGLSIDDVNEGLSSGAFTEADIFDKVIQGILDADTAVEKTELGVALLGTQYEDLGDKAFQMSLDGVGSFENIEGAIGSVDAKYGSLGAVFEGTKRKVLVAIEPIGSRLLDLANSVMPKIEEALEKVMPFIEGIATAFNTFFEVLEDGGSPLDAFLIALGEVLELFGMSDEEIAGVKESILGLLERFTEFKDTLMEFLGPILEAVAGFVSWKDVLIILGTVIGGVILSALISLATAIAPIIAAIAVAIAIVALMRNAWESNFLGIQDKVGAVMAFIGEVIGFYLELIKAFWDEHGEAIMAKAAEIWEAIKSTIDTVIQAISDFISTVIEGITAFWAEHGDTILAKAEEIWNAIQSVIETVIAIIQDVFNAFKSAFEGDWEAFGENLRAAWDKVWAAINELSEKAGQLLIDIVSTIVDAVVGFFTEKDWGQIGHDIIQGIADGVTGAASLIKDAALSAAQAAWDAVKGFFGIDSPSKLMRDTVGKPMAEGVAVGFADGLDSAQRDINSSLQGAITPPGGLSGNGAERGATTVFQIDARGATDPAKKIEEVVRKVLREEGTTAATRLSFALGG